MKTSLINMIRRHSFLTGLGVSHHLDTERMAHELAGIPQGDTGQLNARLSHRNYDLSSF